MTFLFSPMAPFISALFFVFSALSHRVERRMCRYRS
jgi:hypothetical protein